MLKFETLRKMKLKYVLKHFKIKRNEYQNGNKTKNVRNKDHLFEMKCFPSYSKIHLYD